MEKSDRASGGPPAGGIITIALVAAGLIFIVNKPLQSSRPVQPEQHVARIAAPQDIDARLWQDPLMAVSKALQQTPPQGESPDPQDKNRHTEAQFAAGLEQSAQDGPVDTTVLAVMMSGGPYSGQIESRLRTRYAVLAGLRAQGFVPVDNEHLGYFATTGEGLPKVVPFERFEFGPHGHPRPGECTETCRLVVLWFDNSGVDNAPLRRLADLADRLAPRMQGDESQRLRIRWRVLGPSTSDGLRRIVDEASAPGFDATRLQAFGFRFFSQVATAPDTALLRGKNAAEHDTVSSYLATRGVDLLRTIGTDDGLVQGLVAELEKRGLRSDPPGGESGCPSGDETSGKSSTLTDAPSSIAIVSEWDTLYSRPIQRRFRVESEGSRKGFCVTTRHYLRGLDGEIPGEALPTEPDSHSDKSDKADLRAAVEREGKFTEHPEGQSQYDYLRRLAVQLREDDAALRRRFGPESGIRAVGVLGTDVFDKLLVLQALHDALPNAIFFTTDMDAEFFQPREQAWARNLIVVSSFGLRLEDSLQRDFAPFRDGYQTSTYLATLLALDDVGGATWAGPLESKSLAARQLRIYDWFRQPRVFEVSRTGFFDFGDRPDDGPAPCSRRKLVDCGAIHPRGSSPVPSVSFAGRFLSAIAVMLAVCAPVVTCLRGVKRRLLRFISAGGRSAVGRAARASLLVLAGAALVVAPALLLAVEWPAVALAITDDGKPLSFTEGISPWPTYAIRIATLVLCAYLVVRAWTSMTTNTHRIARDLRLGATRRHLRQEVEAEEAGAHLWQRLGAMLSVRFYRERPGVLSTSPGMTPTAIAFWKHYLVQSRPCARLLRTGLWMVVMIALDLLVDNALGGAPAAPVRGHLTRTMQMITILPTALAIQFLIFFVVDATLLSVLFMRGLRLHHANWPERTLQHYHALTGVPTELLNEWIDLEFVGRRTRCIGALIYFPFIVLSMTLLARSSFFDHWETTPSLTVLSTLSFGIALLCAVALRRTAEASRVHAIDRTWCAILRARGLGDDALAEQLEVLRGRMEQRNDGALAPYSQQPLIKAVLLPLVTLGGSSLFDYLTLFGI